MPNDDAPYEVGYRQPPKAHQFARGKSGNPKGRPKGAKGLATIVLQESRQLVRVNGPRGSRKVTKLQAAVMQVGTRAAQGDPRAARELFTLVERSEQAAVAGSSPEILGEADQLVLKILQQRFREAAKSDQAKPAAEPEEASK